MPRQKYGRPFRSFRYREPIKGHTIAECRVCHQKETFKSSNQAVHPGFAKNLALQRGWGRLNEHEWLCPLCVAAALQVEVRDDRADRDALEAAVLLPSAPDDSAVG